MKYLLLVLSLAAPAARAVTLPGNLTAGEIDRIVDTLGMQSSTKLLRSAEAYPSWPGFKIGLELALVPGKNINSFGNGMGSIPEYGPSPRFYLSKGLFPSTEITLSGFPSAWIDQAIATYGGIFKWNFLNEGQSWFSSAFFFGYTHVSAYRSGYSGDNYEIGWLASKDYVRAKPYAGAAVLYARGTMAPSLVQPGNEASRSRINLHVFLGTEVELPVNVAGQLDWIPFSPAGFNLGASFFVGAKI